MATHAELARKSIEELVRYVFEQRPHRPVPLSYEDLTRRIGHLSAQGKPVAISMGDILSIAGHLLEGVGDSWGSTVPHLTALVVAKQGRPDAGLPSAGMKEFWPGYPGWTTAEKERKALAEWDRIADFSSRWNDVLRALDLPEVKSAVQEPHACIGRGGESPEHHALKTYVSQHPECVGASVDARTDIEYALPSGDEIDVFFRSADEWIAVEVKAAISDRLLREYERGLYQTIKYGAVLAAMLRAEPQHPTPRIRSVLVLQSRLPREHWAIRDALNVIVLEQIGPKSAA
jgi:hypothetical protein